jgi:hypothetical protein
MAQITQQGDPAVVAERERLAANALYEICGRLISYFSDGTPWICRRSSRHDGRCA